MNAQEQAYELAKAAPPVTITSMEFMDYAISDWVLLITAIYTTLLIVLLIRRLVVDRRKGDIECPEACPLRPKS